MRAATALLLLPACSAQIHPTLNEAKFANLPFYEAPAYDMDNVTFTCIFYCKQSSKCWRNGAGTAMNGFNRDYFRKAIVESVNEQAEELTEKEENRFRIDAFGQISLDNIREKSAPVDPVYNNLPGTTEAYGGRWNVMARVSLSNIPTQMANDFRPVLQRLFGRSDGEYSEDVAELAEQCWVSTDAHFIDEQLEPYRGRGHKGQMLLIPLMLGLAFMLLCPAFIIAMCVLQANRQNEQEKLYSKEEQRVERLSRELADKEAMVLAHQRQDEEEQERLRKAAADDEEARKCELRVSDLAWHAKPPPEAPKPEEKKKTFWQKVEEVAEDVVEDIGGALSRGIGGSSEYKTLQEVESAEHDRRDLEETMQLEGRQRIMNLRFRELPAEHRIRRWMEVHVARWRFGRMMKQARRQEKEKQKRLAHKKVGSIHIGVDRDSADGVTVNAFIANPDGSAKNVSEMAGLQEGDVLVMVRYDDAKTGGEKRVAEPLEDKGDLSFAVGPAKEVYQDTVLHFSYLRGEEQIAAWQQTRKDGGAATELFEAQDAHADDVTFGPRKQAAKLKLWRRRLKAMADRGMPAHTAVVTVGLDTPGATRTRLRKWKSLKDCDVLNISALNEQNIDDYLSDPAKCREVCRDRFEKADADKSGSLDEEEIHVVFDALARANGLAEPTREETHGMYQRVDLDGNGSISFEEFFPFFRRRIVQIVCELEKEMHDFEESDGWKPRDLSDDRKRQVAANMEAEARKRGGAPGKFTIRCFNRAFQCTVQVDSRDRSQFHGTAHTRDGIPDKGPHRDHPGWTVSHSWSR